MNHFYFNLYTSFGKNAMVLLLLFFFSNSISLSAQGCDYRVDLFDSFGDGWNGATLTISVAGVPTDFTLSTGTFATFPIPVSDGDMITLSYSPGTFEFEVSYELFDSEGNSVFAETAPPSTGEVFTGTASCPTCIAPTDIVVSNLDVTSADASWTAVSNAIGYNIEYGLPGFTPGTGTTANVADPAFSFTGLMEATMYEFYVQADCDAGDLSALAGPFSFATTFQNPCDYTIELFDSFGDGWNGSTLTVTVGTVSTPFTISNGSSATFTIPAGQNLPLSFSYSPGTFEGEVTYNIIDPDGFIIFSDGPNPAVGVVYENLACPTCKEPNGITINDVTFSSADFSWNSADSADFYVIEFGPQGFMQGTGTITTTTDLFTSFTGLTENTGYDFYISSDCGGGETSFQAGPFSFITPFEDPCFYKVDLFDSFGDGWNGSVLTVTVGSISTDYTFTTGTFASFSFPVATGTPIELSYSAGAFQNEVSYNLVDSETNILFSDGPNPATGVVFSSTASCPTCLGPTNIALNNLGAWMLDISWMSVDSADSYNFEYGPAGFTPGTGTISNSIDTFINLTGLTQNTMYEFYVQSDCGSGDLSYNVGPIPFTTLISCPATPELFVNQVFALSADVSWTSGDSSGVFVVEYGPPGFAPGTGTIFNSNTPYTSITGLSENTTYDYYVYIACDNGDNSIITGPATFKTIFLNNVGIIEINSPTTGCELGIETISITMQNFGAAPQTLIPYTFSVNGVEQPVNMPLDGLYTDVIGLDSMVLLEFELTTYDFSEYGQYEIAAWTELDSDSDITNDTAYLTINNIPLVSDIPYYQNFEDGNGGWLVSSASQNPSWQFGTPSGADISNAASGINAWVTNLSGNYNNNERSYITSNCFDLSNLTTDPTISLSVNFETENNFDGGWLEASVDGGVSWYKIGNIGTGVNWYTFNNINTGLDEVWAGNSGGWIFAKHVLTGTAGESDVRLRFGFGSDTSVNAFDGFGVDNIAIYIPVANDLAAQNIINNNTVECGVPDDSLTITIINNGTATQSGFDVGYQINNDPPVIENVGGLVLAPDESATYTFSTTFSSEAAGTYHIIAWTDLLGELNVTNDTTSFEFATYRELPLREDFEGMAIPQGWTTTGAVGNGHNNVSYVMFRNLFTGTQNFEAISPPMGPIAAGDSLTFDYRYTNWSLGTVATVLGAGNELNLQISTDCGATYTTILTIDQSNHIASVTMQTVGVDLTPWAGESVKFRFEALWNSGDYWIDIDNINVYQCAPLILATETTIESFPGAGDGVVTVTPGASVGPYTYEWSNGDTTATITGLAAGEYFVTVFDAFGCSDQTFVTVDVGVNTEEIENVKKITLAPNPTNNIATLDLVLAKSADVRVNLLNVMGQVVYSTSSQKMTEGKFELDLSTFASGIYFVRVSVDDQTIVKKLMRGGH